MKVGRAKEIVNKIYSFEHDDGEWAIEFVDAQIREAEEEAKTEMKNVLGLEISLQKEGAFHDGFEKGFNVAKEQGAESIPFGCDCGCADRIRQMKPE